MGAGDWIRFHDSERWLRFMIVKSLWCRSWRVSVEKANCIAFQTRQGRLAAEEARSTGEVRLNRTTSREECSRMSLAIDNENRGDPRWNSLSGYSILPSTGSLD